MTTEARTILGPAAAALAQAGIASARQDARLLLGLALGRDGAVLPHEDVNSWTNDMDSMFQTYIQRRLAGEPVSRIRGWREFWSLNFELSAATLDPRPDSEILVERAVAEAHLLEVVEHRVPLGERREVARARLEERKGRRARVPLSHRVARRVRGRAQARAVKRGEVSCGGAGRATLRTTAFLTGAFFATTFLAGACDGEQRESSVHFVGSARRRRKVRVR